MTEGGTMNADLIERLANLSTPHLADVCLRFAARMQAGVSFRQQIRFADYLAARRANPAFGFREHLRNLRASIEE